MSQSPSLVQLSKMSCGGVGVISEASGLTA